MARHPRYVKGFNGSHKELAGSIGNMTYDKVADVLGELAAELQRQGEADKERKRTLLAGKLFIAASKLAEAQSAVKDAWAICEPHMNDKQNK